MIATNKRNVPVLFCNFEGSDGQRLSYIQPFTNSRSPAEQTGMLSEWYHRTRANDEICGSQCELLDACAWYDRETYDISTNNDDFIIVKEHTVQDTHDSTIWVVCAEQFGCGFHYHIAQKDCHETVDENNPFNMINGSVGLQGAVDAMMVITRNKQQTKDHKASLT